MKLLKDNYKQKAHPIVSELYDVFIKYGNMIDQDDALFITIDWLHTQIQVFTNNDLNMKRAFYKNVYDTLNKLDSDKEITFK